MRRKPHEPLPQEGLAAPFGPPPEEYLYRCPVCGAERLINEASIEVAIGAAQFRGAYTGAMPVMGCPGCHGETMAYVEQEPSSAHRALAGFYKYSYHAKGA
jgi:hypothetical protein